MTTATRQSKRNGNGLQPKSVKDLRSVNSSWGDPTALNQWATAPQKEIGQDVEVSIIQSVEQTERIVGHVSDAMFPSKGEPMPKPMPRVMIGKLGPNDKSDGHYHIKVWHNGPVELNELSVAPERFGKGVAYLVETVAKLYVGHELALRGVVATGENGKRREPWATLIALDGYFHAFKDKRHGYDATPTDKGKALIESIVAKIDAKPFDTIRDQEQAKEKKPSKMVKWECSPTCELSQPGEKSQHYTIRAAFLDATCNQCGEKFTKSETKTTE
jgi:hypothetical protein